MLFVKAKACPGSDISEVSKDAVELAKRITAIVEINFNGIVLRSGPDDAEDSMEIDYRLALQRKASRTDSQPEEPF